MLIVEGQSCSRVRRGLVDTQNRAVQ